jgi:hypothetical protein
VHACNAVVLSDSIRAVSDTTVEAVGVVVLVPEMRELFGQLFNHLSCELAPCDVPERIVQECLHGYEGGPEQFLAGITCVVAVGTVRVKPVLFEGTV